MLEEKIPILQTGNEFCENLFFCTEILYGYMLKHNNDKTYIPYYNKLLQYCEAFNLNEDEAYYNIAVYENWCFASCREINKENGRIR